MACHTQDTTGSNERLKMIGKFNNKHTFGDCLVNEEGGLYTTTNHTGACERNCTSVYSYEDFGTYCTDFIVRVHLCIMAVPPPCLSDLDEHGMTYPVGTSSAMVALL